MGHVQAVRATREAHLQLIRHVDGAYAPICNRAVAGAARARGKQGEPGRAARQSGARPAPVRRHRRRLLVRRRRGPGQAATQRRPLFRLTEAPEAGRHAAARLQQQGGVNQFASGRGGARGVDGNPRVSCRAHRLRMLDQRGRRPWMNLGGVAPRGQHHLGRLAGTGGGARASQERLRRVRVGSGSGQVGLARARVRAGHQPRGALLQPRGEVGGLERRCGVKSHGGLFGAATALGRDGLGQEEGGIPSRRVDGQGLAVRRLTTGSITEEVHEDVPLERHWLCGARRQVLRALQQLERALRILPTSKQLRLVD